VALAILLALATVALYGRVNDYPFVNYDDTLYVTQNAHVQAGLTWETVRWAFTTYRVGTWHPLTWLSHALDYRMFGLDPGGPHDVNLLLHVMNVLLLFWALQAATGFTGRSFMVAALLALHPMNVESVVWIAERKNSLSMLFFLLALGAYGWWVANRRPTRYLVVVVLFALGLMAKPQVITFPFVLLLWDYWPLGRLGVRSSHLAFRRKDKGELSGERRTANSEVRRLIAEKLPLFALSGISAAITMAAQRADGNKAWYPLALRVGYALVSYVQYIGKAIWPARLSAFYPHPDFVPLSQALAAAAFLALVTAAVVAWRRSRPYLLVGWFFFLGTLVPMLGLEGVGYQGRQGIADRYAYLPFVGLFIMVCWGVAELPPLKTANPVWLRGVSVAALLGLSMVSYRQLGYWQDNVSLWSHALQVTQGNFLAENNLGRALLAEGRVEEGVAHFYRAVAIYPDDPVGNLNVGIYEQKRGNFPAAIERYRRTAGVTRDPELKLAALRNMAICYRQLGDIGGAQRSEEAAERIRR